MNLKKLPRSASLKMSPLFFILSVTSPATAGIVTSGFNDDLPGHTLLWETDLTSRDGWFNVSPTSRAQIDVDEGVLYTQEDGIAGPGATLTNSGILGQRLDLEAGEVTTTVLYANGRFDGDASTDTLWYRFRAGNPRGPMPNIAVGIRGDGTMLALGMGSHERLLTTGDHEAILTDSESGVNVSLADGFQQYRLVVVAVRETGNLTLRFDHYDEGAAAWEEISSIEIEDYKARLGGDEPHSTLDAVSVFFRTTGEFVSDLAITQHATGVPLEIPLHLPLGMAAGRDPGDELDRSEPGEWSLEDEALRLTAAGADYRNALATAEVINFVPGESFALRSRLTLAGLDSGAADNAAGHIVLASGEGIDPDSSGFYSLQWLPNASGGSVLRIREGMSGTTLAEEPWTGLHPSSANPEEGIGAVYTLKTRGAYGSGGELELTFTLADETGFSAGVSTTIWGPLVGNRFGFGARHRAAENAVWDFHDFSMTDLRRLEFDAIEAPISFDFGTGKQGFEGLLREHPRPEDWSVAADGLRYQRDAGGFESSATVAVVSNYQPGQDFTVEAEVTPHFLAGGGLNRFGLVVLGRTHDPFEAPFDVSVDAHYYSLQWLPRQTSDPDTGDPGASTLRIRHGFNGNSLVPNVVWEGMHPDDLNPWEGLGQPFQMRAEGTYDASGALELSFTLTDPNSHSQTITAVITEPIEGNVFGIGGRMRSDELPIVEFNRFALELGELPSGPTFAEWQAQHFTEAQRNDPEVGGLFGTPAGDGIPNLLKYAADLLPWAPATNGDLGVAAIADGQLTLAYSELRDAQDIEYIVEISTNLEDWNSGPSFVEEISRTDAGAVEEVVARALLPAGTSKGFIRVRVLQK